MLAEAGLELGVRLAREAGLPEMNEYIRVRDHPTGKILKMTNLYVFLVSKISTKDVLDFGTGHAAMATGAYRNRDRFDG